VIVNESFVRKFGLGSNAVGTVLRLEGSYLPQNAVEIVGVVADAKYSHIRNEITPQVFTPRRPATLSSSRCSTTSAPRSSPKRLRVRFPTS
jgi:hypothetical protein